jgi:hypothetical protein
VASLYGTRRAWTQTQTSGASISGLLFGEFDDVRGTDVAAVANDAWSYSSGATRRWARLNSKRSDSFADAVAADFDGNGRSDIAFVEGRKWRVSRDGRSGLAVVRNGVEELRPPLVGRFVPVGGSLPGAQVVGWTRDPVLGIRGLRLSVWRGLGTGNGFANLSAQNMR